MENKQNTHASVLLLLPSVTFDCFLVVVFIFVKCFHEREREAEKIFVCENIHLCVDPASVWLTGKLIIKLTSSSNALLPLDGLGKQFRLNLWAQVGTLCWKQCFKSIRRHQTGIQVGSVSGVKKDANKHKRGKSEILVLSYLVLLVKSQFGSI